MKDRALFLGTISLRDYLRQLPNVFFDARFGDELELSQEVDLLERVEEVAGDRDGGADPADLPRHPGLDLDPRQLGGVIEEEREGVRDHQGRELVGQIALQLVEREPRFHVGRLVIQSGLSTSSYSAAPLLAEGVAGPPSRVADGRTKRTIRK